MVRRPDQATRSNMCGPFDRATLSNTRFRCRFGRSRWRTVGVLLIVVLVLAACGAPDSTAGTGSGFGFGATAPATPPEVVIEEASPKVDSTPGATPHALSIDIYATAVGQINKSQEQLLRRELSLVASGASTDAIDAQSQSDLPAWQALVNELQRLNPPDEYKTYNIDLIVSMTKEISSLQLILQARQTGDQAQIAGGTEAFLDNEWTQSICGGKAPPQVAESLNGTPSATPASSSSATPAISDYANAIKAPLTDLQNQYRSLCPIAFSSESTMPFASLKQILPATTQDVAVLANIVPPAALSEYHQLLVAGWQKMIASEQLAIQGYEQNDEQLNTQSRATMAEAELKMLDAQDVQPVGLLEFAPES